MRGPSGRRRLGAGDALLLTCSTVAISSSGRSYVPGCEYSSLGLAPKTKETKPRGQ